MSLIKIIFAIMNCHNIGIVNRCIQESIIDKDDNKSTQNILVLDEKDSKNIRNSFEPLYLNRLKSGESELAKEVPQP